MAVKKNEIKFSDVQKFAKMLGINVVGKKRAKAIEMVLDAIVVDYEKNQGDLTKAEFQKYKKNNSEILNWYNEFKDWEEPKGAAKAEPEETKPEDTESEDTKPEDTKPEDTKPEDTKPEDTKAEGTEPEERVDEGEGKGKKKAKDLSGTKGRVKKAKDAKEKAKKEPKKEGTGAKTDEPPYIPRYRKQIANADTVPGKIRECIRKKGKITLPALMKFAKGKAPTWSDASVKMMLGATIRVLALDKAIKMEGSGEKKTLTFLK